MDALFKLEVIPFTYKPSPQLASMISQIVPEFSGTMPGILPPGLVKDLKNSKIYATCHTVNKDGVMISKNVYAVVARSDVDAERVYGAWTDTTGSVIGILEDNAAKANVTGG